MRIIPPYLQAGDTIGICCPSGALQLETVANMIGQLEFWGFNVKVGSTVGTQYHKFSGTDRERLTDFQNLLDDDEVKAILFGRGGYGFVRIIDAVDFDKFKQQPKWLLGFSDITVLHSHIHRHFGIPTIHAHMSGGYLAESFDNDSTMSIYHALTGKPCEYQIQTNTEQTNEKCQGELIGGNLAIISDLVGTISDIDTAGKILVLEDIGEYRYNIDRMMWQLLRAGKLHELSGLIVGGFSDTKDDEPGFGMNEYEIIYEKVTAFNYPVCFGFPVGHQPKNLALKFGIKHELIFQNDKITLKEMVSNI